MTFFARLGSFLPEKELLQQPHEIRLLLNSSSMFHHNPSCFRPTNFACISIILTRTDTVSEKKKAQSFAERVFVLLKEKKVCLINWLRFDFFYKFPYVLKGAPPFYQTGSSAFFKSFEYLSSLASPFLKRIVPLSINIHHLSLADIAFKPN